MRLIAAAIAGAPQTISEVAIEASIQDPKRKKPPAASRGLDVLTSVSVVILSQATRIVNTCCALPTGALKLRDYFRGLAARPSAIAIRHLEYMCVVGHRLLLIRRPQAPSLISAQTNSSGFA